MNAVIDKAALLVTMAGLVAAAAAMTTGRPLLALPVLLDMLLAASLLRLASHPSPAQLGTTALLITVKRVASYGLHHIAGHPASEPSR